MRSLKGGQPWLLLESSASATSWRDVNVPKAPGKMRVESLQAVAHGSDAVMFFQWRQAKYGQEKFHSSMLGHRGERSRTFQETKALGARAASSSSRSRGTRVRSRVALVVDWDSWWGSARVESLPSQRLRLGASRPAPGIGALYALGQPVDVVRATGPVRQLRRGRRARTSTSSSRRAGRCAHARSSRAADTWSSARSRGVVDPTEKVHDGGAPGPLRDLLGVEVDEQWPLADGEERSITPTPMLIHPCRSGPASGPNGSKRPRPPKSRHAMRTASSTDAPRSCGTAAATDPPGT